MEQGFNRLPRGRIARRENGLMGNMFSATNLTSYRPAKRRANSGAHPGDAVTMEPREKLALIIPALYEAQNLGGLLSAVRDALSCVATPWEVIVVDDESRDGTEEIVSTVAEEDSRVSLLLRRGERGLSGAILHGWRHSDATILGVMDADGQHPAKTLPSLLDSIRAGHDVAIASRYSGGGHCAVNPIRRIISIAASAAAGRLQPAKLRVNDPLSGFF